MLELKYFEHFIRVVNVGLILNTESILGSSKYVKDIIFAASSLCINKQGYKRIDLISI